jgi:dUTP pyrophosphatase
MDSGWRGEWFVPITNHNTKPLIITKETNKEVLVILSEDYIIHPYSKAICQAVVLPVPELEIEELTYEELLGIKSERGLGCLGSTNK